MTHSKAQLQTFIRSFFIRNPDGTPRTDIEKYWLEARTVTAKELRFQSIESNMHPGIFVTFMSDKVAYELRIHEKAEVIISYQILKTGQRLAFLRLVDQKKLDAYNSKIPTK